MPANTCATRLSVVCPASTDACPGSERDTSARSCRVVMAAQRASCDSSPRQASTTVGSNHFPERRRTSANPAAGPPSAANTSNICASPSTRAAIGIWSPFNPRGWPWPSQCSSSVRTASATPAPKLSCRTISAPRSQRICTSRVAAFCPSRAIEATRFARSNHDAPGALCSSA